MEKAHLFLALFLIYSRSVLSHSPSLTREPEYIVALTERNLLMALEKKGLAFGDQLGGKQNSSRTNREVCELQSYSQIVSFLAGDLEEAKTRFSKVISGVKPHTLPLSWLCSKDTRFELVGIVNRIDRKVFSDNTCGEYRLIYRLRYDTGSQGKQWKSRLPMTVMIVRGLSESNVSDPYCVKRAAEWSIPKDESQQNQLAWLLGRQSPISSALSRKAESLRIEINVQIGRFEPSFRPDIGGHNEYLLRVFEIDERRRNNVRVIPLENTPDVERLLANPTKKKALLSWLQKKESLEAIDMGTSKIPVEYLATKAVSVAPLGIARLANRPFLQLFNPKDFKELSLSRFRSIQSPDALLRRLDGMSCVGCHQVRSLSGFHFLGEDGPEEAGVNALFLPGSPHFLSELKRRQHYGTSIIKGINVLDEFRPLPERDESDLGLYGAHCGLNNVDFPTWTCSNGYQCQPDVAAKGDSVGICLPDESQPPGGPCFFGTITKESNPFLNRMTERVRKPCQTNELCAPPEIGFPGGLCLRRCTQKGEGICQRVPALSEFSKCLSESKTLKECFEQATSPVALPSCDDVHACRDDYVCALSTSGKGVCVPPYLLAQLAINHPIKR